MKKIISIITVVAMILACCVFSTGTVYAAEGDYTYKTLSATTAQITGYTGTGGNITIPSELGGYTVVSIGNQAFYQNKTIKNVTVPNTVKSIGEKAFAGSFITGVTLADSVETLGNSAFSFCIYLENVTLCESIDTISNNCFSTCTRLEEIVIPEGVKTIAISAFQSCNHLAEITLPSTLEAIGEYAFAYTAITELNIPEGTEEIGASAFFICDKLQSVTIPSTVKSIADWAFCNCYALTEVNLAEGLEVIGANAFDSCPLSKLKVPATVTEIGEYAFGYIYDEFAFNYVKYEEFDMICAESSAGFEYAVNNGFDYEIFEPVVTNPTEPSTGTNPMEPTTPKYEKGDATMDGHVNIKDATAIQKQVADLIELEPMALYLAEYDGDSKITVKDATAIQKFIAGIA